MADRQLNNRLVRYQYVEDLIRGKAVLELGCGTGQGTALIATVADSVVAVDTSEPRVTAARRRLSVPQVDFQNTRPESLDFADAAFDVVLVPELQRWATHGRFVPEVRRVLRASGWALFAVPAQGDAGGMDYGDLHEYLTHSFRHVRMMGEIPFWGVTIADFAPEGPIQPVLDCSLIEEDEAPEWYTAICSDELLPPSQYSVVQTSAPRESERVQTLSLELSRARSELQTLQAESKDRLAEAERRGEQERAELQRIKAQLARSTRTPSPPDVTASSGGPVAPARLEAAEAALVEVRGLAAEQRRRAEGAERRCDRLVHRIEQDAAELARLQQRLAETQGQRQLDQWRVEELVGRLRAIEQDGAVEASQLGTSRASGDATSDKQSEGHEGVSARAPAQQRVTDLTKRCDELMGRLRACSAQLERKDADLRLARQAADPNVIHDLRARTEQVQRLERCLREAEAKARRPLSVKPRTVTPEPPEASAVGDLAASLSDTANSAGSLAVLREGANAHKQAMDRLVVQFEELKRVAAEQRAAKEDSWQMIVALRRENTEMRTKLDALRVQVAARGRSLAECEGKLRRCQHEATRLLARPR